MTVACHACAFANPPDARFCGNCGTRLAVQCGECGHANPPSFNFCTQCGTPLDGRAGPVPAAVAPMAATAAVVAFPAAASAAPAASATSWPVIADLGPERRHLTVLFCDLVGSTGLAQELDPEDLRVVMRAYETASSDVIERFGGYVAQYYGDGVLAYFGYPVAHEDAAERAVRAALALVQAVAEVPAPRGLQVRVGIHSGMVVVGMEKSGVPGKANSAVGEAPNIAARLQALADPNTVLISADTHALVRARFAVADAGSHPLKGIDAEVRVFRVLGDRDGPRLDDGEAGAEPMPLVGRERDLAAILDSWAKARDGRGQVVLVSGEAGIGKSRLVREVRACLGDQPYTMLRHHCSPFHQTSPLFPIAEAVEAGAAIRTEDLPGTRVAKIDSWLQPLDMATGDAPAVMAELLNVPADASHSPPLLTHEQRKQRTFAVLLSVIERAAREAPVLFVVADLQWADPSTIEFLGLVVDQVPTQRVLVLLTFRPEFAVPWPARAHVLPLTLARLDAAESAAMAEHVAGGKPLPPELRERIVERGDGVPMFIEELTRTVLASGFLVERDGRYELAGELPPVAIPASLQDSLMARLDRLGRYKEVAQIGAMLGRAFRYDLLAAVSGLDAATLDEALAALVAEELLLRRGLPPHASYIFRQTLVQEVAYESLLRSRRQALHRQIGEILEARFPEIAEAEPEAVARHYAAAGVTDRAVDFCQRAAARAVRASAMREALAHADCALDMLARMPAGAEARRAEMELQVMRGIALGSTNGFGDPQVGDAYGRALDLSRESGDKEAAFRARVGLYGHFISLGDLQETGEIAESLVALASEAGRDDMMLAAYTAAGLSRSDRGDVAGAADYLERALDKLDSGPLDEARALGAQEPGVVAWSLLAHNRFLLGFPDRAREASLRARERGAAVRHANSLNFALSVGGAVLAQMRDWAELARVSAEAAALADAHGFRPWQVHSAIYHGLAEVKLGRVREGLAEIARGRALGEQGWQNGPFTFFRVAFAEAYLTAGMLDAAAGEIDSALDQLEVMGGRAYEAELNRLRGSVLALGADQGAAAIDDAARAFEAAIAIARRGKILAWELRAALALARLRDRDDAAIKRLRAVYERFDEGFETADLAEARSLLEAVAA